MAFETLPGKWKSVKSSASGTRSRIASSTCSPPRIPVSQSWMTATLPRILLPLRFRRRRQRIVALGRALVAEMVVAQILVRRNLAEAAHAEVASRAFVHLSPRRIIEHRYGCSTEYDSVFLGRRGSMIRVRRAEERGHYDHGWL